MAERSQSRARMVGGDRKRRGAGEQRGGRWRQREEEQMRETAPKTESETEKAAETSGSEGERITVGRKAHELEGA